MCSEVGETGKLKGNNFSKLALNGDSVPQRPQMNYMHFDGICYLMKVPLPVPDSRKSFLFTVKLGSEGNNSVS